jgi:F0F1-type ATP synthase assembly protein I
MTSRPDEKDQTRRQATARRQGLAYQGSFEAVTAILIAAGIGYWIDARFETSPYGLFIGTIAGFSAFVLRLLRLGKQLEKLGDPALADGDEEEPEDRER